LEAFSHMGAEPSNSESVLKWQIINKQSIHSYFGRDDIAKTFALIQKLTICINNPIIANVIDFKIHLSMSTTTTIFDFIEVLIKKSKINQLPDFIDKWDSQTIEEAFFGYVLFPIEIDEIFQPLFHQFAREIFHYQLAYCVKYKNPIAVYYFSQVIQYFVDEDDSNLSEIYQVSKQLYLLAEMSLEKKK
jgi:hypothetical protein